MKTSNLFSLDLKDGLKGALMAAITGGLTIIYQALATPEGLSIENLKRSGTVALICGIGYLLKNFFTGASIKEPISK